jgi:hypothetical protein
MSTLIDLDDVAALEKLGQALCKIPSVVISLTNSMIQIPEARKIILANFDSPEFGHNVEKVLLTSELKPIKRIAELETVTGTNDFSDFEEEDHEPTLPEQISLLEEKIEAISEPVRAPIKPVNVPTSKTEIRACALVNHLKETGKDHLTTHEIIHFLKSKLPDNCKINENIQNIRKVKQDVLNKATLMYPNVFLNKKKTGHKEVRLVLSS